jgi:hypothetical protein
MKKLVICIVLLFGFTGSYARRPFLIVSVNNHHRPVKGYFVRTGDSALVLVKGKDSIQLNYRNIQSVKTGKSTGHDIFLGAVIGASAGTVIGLAGYQKPEPNTVYFFDYGPGFDATLGLLTGATLGAVVGGVYAVLKHRERFEVKGLYENWMALKEKLPH